MIWDITKNITRLSDLRIRTSELFDGVTPASMIPENENIKRLAECNLGQP